MKKTKFNQDLLNEELKKFKLICEYKFHTGITEEAPDPTADISKELGVDEPDTEIPDAAATGDAALNPELGGTPEPDGVDSTGAEQTDTPAENPAPEPEMAPAISPSDGAEEIDVTSLVNNTDEAKMAAGEASHNSEILMQKLNYLEQKLMAMDSVSAKIEELEHEIIKRNPTNVEKLEMQSLHSAPYTQKLSDYWNDKEGMYDVMNNEPKKKEYVLTKDDVDNFSDGDIKQSFNVKPENDYEEEEY